MRAPFGRRTAACLLAAAISGSLSLGAAGADVRTPAGLHIPAALTGRPHPLAAAATALPFWVLRTAPVTITVNSTSYNMTSVIEQLVKPAGQQPVMGVRLRRTTAGPAEQDHLYSFFPTSGFTTVVNTGTLAGGSFNSTSSINPSSVVMTYTASSPETTGSCRLPSGATGHIRRTSGTISAQTYSITTDTSPFFGTISTAPTAATLTYNPGCVGPAAPKYPTCAGRETISNFTNLSAGFRAAFAEVGFRGTHTAQAYLSSTFTQTTEIDHELLATAPGSDLVGSHWATGASAHWTAVGNPFMSGKLNFTTPEAPVIRTNRACVYEGKIRHFDSWRYHGRLNTDTVTPMQALFDTGTLAVPDATNARIIFRRYIN